MRIALHCGIMTRWFRFRWSFLILFVLSATLFACDECAAGEWRSEELNCALTLPAGPEWKQPSAPNPAVPALAQTIDQSTTVMLMVVPLPARAKLDDEFVRNYEEGRYQFGKSKKLSGERLTIQGVPAYRATYEIGAAGNSAYSTTIVWIADGKFYSLGAIKRTGPPLEDPSVRAFLASFHFLKPPGV